MSFRSWGQPSRFSPASLFSSQTWTYPTVCLTPPCGCFTNTPSSVWNVVLHYLWHCSSSRCHTVGNTQLSSQKLCFPLDFCLPHIQFTSKPSQLRFQNKSPVSPLSPLSCLPSWSKLFSFLLQYYNSHVSLSLCFSFHPNPCQSQPFLHTTRVIFIKANQVIPLLNLFSPSPVHLKPELFTKTYKTL